MTSIHTLNIFSHKLTLIIRKPKTPRERMNCRAYAAECRAAAVKVKNEFRAFWHRQLDDADPWVKG